MAIYEHERKQKGNGIMSVTVTVDGGPTVEVDWHLGINAQGALEAAWERVNSTVKGSFTYELQYFGKLGYLVSMMNDTHETYSVQIEPNFFWEFYYKGEPATVGIDGQELNDGDQIRFAFEPARPDDATAWKTAKSGRSA
jgi:hypothetical protein